MEDERATDDDEQELGREVENGQDDVQFHGLADPEYVQPHEQEDDCNAGDDVPRRGLQRRPEDRQVMGHEIGRDRDRDDVVEHLAPGREEARNLVEGVARETGRAARLGEANRSLGVGERGRQKEDAGDDEDKRRQPESETGGYAERVIDRGADVSVSGRR